MVYIVAQTTFVSLISRIRFFDVGSLPEVVFYGCELSSCEVSRVLESTGASLAPGRWWYLNYDWKLNHAMLLILLVYILPLSARYDVPDSEI